MMELKPCPFCGEPAEYYDENRHYANCININCAMVALEIPVDQWNTRANEADGRGED